MSLSHIEPSRLNTADLGLNAFRSILSQLNLKLLPIDCHAPYLERQDNMAILGNFLPVEEVSFFTATARLGVFVSFALVALNSIMAAMIVSACFWRSNSNSVRYYMQKSCRVFCRLLGD